MPDVYDRWGRLATLPPGVTRLYRRDGTVVDFGGVTPPVPSGKTLADYKWVPLGDSLTDITGPGYNGTTFQGKVIPNGYKYHLIIRDLTGITVYNYSDGESDKYMSMAKDNLPSGVVMMGVGGTGYCAGSNGLGGDQCFYSRIKHIPLDTDVVTIYGSVNDWAWNPHNFGISLGSPTDNWNYDIPEDSKQHTYAEYVNRCIDEAKKRCPNVKIIMIGTPYFNGGNQAFWRDATDMNRQIAELRGIPFYDLYNDHYYGKTVPNVLADREVICSVGGTKQKIPSGSLSYKKVHSDGFTRVYSQEYGNGHPSNEYNLVYTAPKIASILAYELGVDAATLPDSLRLDTLVEEQAPITCTGITAAYVGDAPKAGDVLDRTNFMIHTNWSDGTTRLCIPFADGMSYDDTLYDKIYFTRAEKTNGQATITMEEGDNSFYVLYGGSGWFSATRSQLVTVTADAAVMSLSADEPSDTEQIDSN